MKEAAGSAARLAAHYSLGIDSKVEGMWKGAGMAEFAWGSEEKHSLLR
jgi:hypothetical protein